MTIRRWGAVFAICAAVVLCGCSGGSSGGENTGGSNPVAPTPSSDWGAMVWDQDNWG